MAASAFQKWSVRSHQLRRIAECKCSSSLSLFSEPSIYDQKLAMPTGVHKLIPISKKEAPRNSNCFEEANNP